MLEETKQNLMELARRDGGARMLAAVSGGRDSMCLLHLLSTWGRKHGLTVTAAHFNHQLRGENADRDAAFVRDWCAGYGVPFVLGSGDTRALAAREHLSVEEAARQLRYAFLERAAAEGNCGWILTAHHADDSAETMLLNLIRGTGSGGLAGIPRLREKVARPFRNVTRAELAEYAEMYHLLHMEDETNETDDAARNLLRHRVLPVLREINPRAVENMARAAGILEAENVVLEAAAGRIAAHAHPIPKGILIRCTELTNAPSAVGARAALRLLESVCGHRKDLTAAHAESMLQLARSPAELAVLSLPYGLRARIAGGDLLIEQVPGRPEEMPVSPGGSVRFGSWTVSLSSIPGAGYTYELNLPAGENLNVTLWRRDDRMTLPGGRGARTLKRLCADAGISPVRRDALPVLRSGARPAAVPGVGIDAEFAPRGGSGKLFVTFNER